MKISHFVILSIVLSVSLHSAYGEVGTILTVSTDKTQYSEGDIILISGDVSEILFGSEINLMIIAPDGNIIFIDKLMSDSNKNFQTKLDTNVSRMKSGTYTILTMYDNENPPTKTTFGFEQLTVNSILEEQEQKKLLNFDFINPDKKSIQEHVDYKITVSKNGVGIFGPSSLTHSSIGKVSIPMIFEDNQPYDVLIDVYGIMFKPIPVETLSFSIISSSENIQSKYTSINNLKINLAIDKDPSGESKVIPDWIKNNTKWWADGLIDYDSFTPAMQYLINEGIVDIPDMPYPSSWMDKTVPLWVKNNASWWADDLIDEDDFIKGIKYLVEKGVIQV